MNPGRNIVVSVKQKNLFKDNENELEHHQNFIAGQMEGLTLCIGSRIIVAINFMVKGESDSIQRAVLLYGDKIMS
jgi:hypothetical protein